MTNQEDFFYIQMEQSKVKSTIVSKYFKAWVQIMKRLNKIAYVDLFAGPGCYEDGSESTPIIILKQVVRDPEINQKLVTIFNDKENKHINSLQKTINTISEIKKLIHQPRFLNYEVGEEIFKNLQDIREIPSLFFVDPYGYKGLSIDLFGKILSNWGCDCIFFFNYNRINMGLGNLLVEEHMNNLFGKKQADELRKRIHNLSSEERELEIIEAICQSLYQIGGKYVLPFRFISAKKDTVSHHLIFCSKNETGYKIMKEIMAKESSVENQGVASFEYNPASIQQPLLSGFYQPLEELGNILLDDFSGQTLTVSQIYKTHNIGRCYIEKNYKDVLKKLEREGKIIVNPLVDQRRKNTMGNEVKISFPHRN